MFINEIVKKHFRPYWLQIISSTISSGFASILYLSFSRQHATLFILLSAELVSCSSILTYLIIRRSSYIRRDIMMGFFLIAIAMLVLLVFPFSLPLMYIYYALSGVGAICFFVAYNILFFSDAQQHRHLRDMTFYWSIFVIIGAVAPILAAYLLHTTNLSVYLLSACAILLGGAWLASCVSRDRYIYTKSELFHHLKGLRTITAIDGALHKVVYIVISLWGLKYITTEMDYGKFLSVVGVVAILVGFRMATVSDKLQKRAIFIWPLSIAAGITTILFFFVDSFVGFLVLALILKAFTVLVEPIRSNIIQDKREKAPINWISREIFLNLGRTSLIAVIVGILYFHVDRGIFIVLGLLHISFPFMVHFKKIYRGV
ncbi:MAG: hypothetical protein WCW16_03245 [Candidatus Magasanikbacteria bacterium]